ncbi:hypothetical protein QUF90_03175 [Desulfococcaceae bacterium HSG9]|nr:hypothetical protein [Desulfococcaceae bacterium HSG9]
MFVANVSPVPLESHIWGLSGHGGFGFYKYAAPTELKTDMPFVTFQKLFDLLDLPKWQLFTDISLSSYVPCPAVSVNTPRNRCHQNHAYQLTPRFPFYQL